MKNKKRIIPIILIFIMGLTMYTDTSYEVSANAHGSINLRDGNATWDSGGYRPNSVHSGEQSDTHARDVDPAVERAWRNNNIERAGKYPRSIYNPNRGNRLGYDVYQGNTNHTYKQSWRITRSGGEDFFTFDGWAVNNGYYHHDNHNQATYIVAENANNSNDFHIYKTRLTNLNAGKDLEYNKQSNTGPITNKCPNTGDGAFMRYSDECNMEYKWVGFRAYIPLNDLFESGNEEYDLYLIKSVSGRGNHGDINKMVYDQLRMPYESETVNWNNGELSLSSGTDLSDLRMVTDNVIRQTTPRGTGSGWDLGWFTEGSRYDFRSQSESSGVTAWFGVRSHHDNNNTRYAPSMYWEILGDQAMLSWEQSTADVRVRHINENTDSVLRTDWHRDLNIGERHTFHPESRGTWTDNDGNPFVPIDDSRTITLNGNTTIDFHYKASIPDPTDSHEMDGSTEGLAEGEFSWKLNKQDDDGESRMLKVEYNLPAIAGPQDGELITEGVKDAWFEAPAWLQGRNAAKKFNTLIWSFATGVILYGLLLLILRKRVGAAIQPLLKNIKPELVDEIVYRAVAIGFPVFTLGGLIFASIWAQIAWDRFWGWDPKEVWALVTWFFYAAFLHLRLSRGWHGEKSAWLAVGGFAIIMFNLIVVNLVIAGLHSYA